jgi:hypothetical protein
MIFYCRLPGVVAILLQVGLLPIYQHVSTPFVLEAGWAFGPYPILVQECMVPDFQDKCAGPCERL